MRNYLKGGFLAAMIAIALAAAPVRSLAAVHQAGDASDSIAQGYHELQQGSSFALIHEARADEPSAMASPEPESAGQKIGGTLEDIANHIPLEGVVVTILLFVYDFVRRKFPTAKPASLWRDISAVLHGLMALISKIDQLGDKIFGQAVKK